MNEKIKLLLEKMHPYYTKIKGQWNILKNMVGVVYQFSKPYILNLYKFFRYAFFPRFIIIIGIWGICRMALFYLGKLNFNISFVPLIEYEYMTILVFLTTLLDTWLLVSILAFFIVTLYRTIIEIKNERI